MPSTSSTSRFREWATSQRNLTIFTAILVALPAAYAFQATVGGRAMGGDFLLLVTLAVGVPTAYDNYWPAYDQTWTAVLWVLAACAVATGVYVGVFLLGTDVVGLAPFPSAIGAFLVTDLGGLGLLTWLHGG